MNHYYFGLAVGLLACMLASPILAADQTADRAAIENQVESYTAAFNAGDAEALAKHWSEDAVYSNPLTGEQVEGRDAIIGQFSDMLTSMKDAKLVVDTSAIDFLSPSVAMEQGTAKLIATDADPIVSHYTAIHVKHDGQWLLDRVSEEEDIAPPSNYEQLRDLEWMVGTWVDEDDQARVETTCQWAKNQSFLTRAFTISIADRIDMSGMQIVGWDPSQSKIRSWVFDSDGGFGEATWEKKGNRWLIDAAATLPDGRKTSAMNIMTVEDNDTIAWQSIGRELDGEILPNIEPVKVVRSAPSADGSEAKQ